ncbi:MAG: iron ABC transporter permease [Myxococcaceae bacterium]|nr:iron ABC transporter permease [Myxococcaceae bacterium]
MRPGRGEAAFKLAAVGLLSLLVAFTAVPLLVLVARAASAAGELGLWSLWSSPATLQALRGTLVTSTGAAAMSFVLGLPLAVLLERTDLPHRHALRAAFTLPTAIPPFIWGMGWVALANPRAGLLNRALGAGTVDIYSGFGVAFVLGAAGLPLVMLPAAAVLARLDPSHAEAARDFGAGPVRTHLAVPVRLALPAAASGAALVFLFAAAAFGVPYLLGVTATPPTPTLTTRIYAEMLMGPAGLWNAAAYSLLLLAMAVVVLLLSRLLGRSGRTALLSGKGLKQRALQLGPLRTPLSAAVIALALVLVVAPLLAVALASLTTPAGDLTVSHWGRVLADPRTLSATVNSVALSLAAAAAVTTLGLVLSMIRRRSAALGHAAELLAAWPYAVPGTVLAIALLAAFSRDLRFVFFDSFALVLALANTLWLLLLAWVAKHLAFGTRNAAEGLARVDPSLAEAARVSGAGPLRAFVDAVVPQLKGPLAAAFTLTFLTCATELTLAVLLVPPGRDVLGTLLFELQSYADPASAAVIACAFVLFVLAVLGTRAALVARRVDA